MKWIADVDLPKPTQLVIEHDPAVGFYLYVFEFGRCTRDYLQDTYAAAIAQAESEFGVSNEKWRLAQ
jgi:hypothetical protein